jgi:hypothetical protein
MTYYINPIWFYLMNVCDGLGTLSSVVGGVFGFGTIALTVLGLFAWACRDEEDEEDEEDWNSFKKHIKLSLIITVVFLSLSCIIPSKETCEEMMIASVVTHENVDQAKDDIKSIVDYVFDRIESNDSESE